MKIGSSKTAQKRRGQNRASLNVIEKLKKGKTFWYG
jgi:hypothetical protein